MCNWEVSFHRRIGLGIGPLTTAPVPQGPPVRTRSADSGEDVVVLPSSALLEFAQKYFRDPRRRPRWVV